MKKIIYVFLVLFVVAALFSSCQSESGKCNHENHTDPTCTESSECLDCGVFMDYATGHDESDWKIFKEATKTEDGVERRECNTCGAVIRERKIYATGSVGLEYGKSDSGLTAITGIGTCTDTDIVIPERIDGQIIMMIDELAFKNCTDITSITISSAITTIGDYAFQGCTGLTEITIPENVVMIGQMPFSNCSNLKTVYYNSPFEENERYNKFVFSESSVNKVVFGGEKVPQFILRDCVNVQEVVILDSVVEIDESAFLRCINLTSISISDSVEVIGEYAFASCTSLKSVELPDSVKTVGRYAFFGCSSIANIRLSHGMTVIEGSVFNNCSSLLELEIPSNIKIIESEAFSGCESLQSLVIPDGVTQVYGGAFSGCDNIKSVVIGSGLELIMGDFPFRGLEGLVSIVVDENNPFYRSESNCIIEKATNKLVRGCVLGTIPDGVTKIADYAFAYLSELKSITIPASVTKIGENAFYDCTSLESVIFEGAVDSIGGRAFARCEKLETVVARGMVTYVGLSAFNGCTSLKSVDFSAGVNSIDAMAFIGCENLESFTISPAIRGIGNNAIQRCDKLQKINFTGTVSEWEKMPLDMAWLKHTAVTEIVCSDGTVKLG